MLHDPNGPARAGRLPRHARARRIRSGRGSVASLALVSLLLAAAVALLISGARDGLPRVAGLDYRVIQIGLILLVLLFGLYTYEREKRFHDLTEELIDERVESARKSAGLDFLRQVQTERDMVAALLAASADGIMLVNPNRRIERMNPALETLSGWKLNDQDSLRCEDVLGCRRDSKLACGELCPFERVFASGETLFDHTFQARRSDGSHRWLAGVYAPVRTEEDRIAFGVGSLRDVTHNKEVEQLQHDFVSIVSHELRGPLTAIKGFVKTLMLKSDQLPSETRAEFLGTINEQADRLNQLVEDLLNVSRIESRRLKMKFNAVDLEALVRKLIGQFGVKWGDREIMIEADPTLPLVVADLSKVEEIFVNLIDNAVKYSPAGGPVRIGLYQSEGRVEIAVEDAGIGIAPEDAARLFEKFHRIATPQTRDIGGTGLGLFIVKSLVEAHGGTIHVTSAPDEGSTFTVALPTEGPPEAEE